jgi:hypothetical protein
MRSYLRLHSSFTHPPSHAPPDRSAERTRRRPGIALLALAFLFVFSGSLLAQGVTTAGIEGVVTSEAMQPLVGTTITAIHEPSGTQYSTTSRSGGVFTIGGMRVGGPYSVSVRMIGFREETQQEIYLNLGQDSRLDFALEETAIELEGLTVEATQDLVLNADRTGAATFVPQVLVETLPSVSRSTRDLIRTDPRNDGNYSFGGKNWLYNNITLDGSYFNNSFGLDDPAPGGQARTEPVPYDAVEQVVVSVAPFDVRQGGFTGANINTVTKSGTNEFKGSAYTFFRNENLVGNKIRGEKLIANPDLSFNQYGFSLGGPLIPDKLFFFINGEISRRDNPGSNFVPRTSSGPPATGESRPEQSRLEEISQRMQAEYQYETGPYSGFVHGQDSDKLIAKVDWNLGSNNNFTFRYNRLKGFLEQPPHPFVLAFTARGPNESSLPSQNSGYKITNELNSYAFEWNSRGARWANRLFASYNRFRDYRDAFSEAFPTIDIVEDGVQYTSIGHEPFSIENNLDTDAWQFTNDFTYFTGRHSLTFGANFELFGFFNSFNFARHGLFGFLEVGNVAFLSVDDFLAATHPDSADQRDFRGMIGTGEFKGEVFDLGQLGVYVQDEFAVNPRFSLTAGLRVDFPMYFTDPVDNPFSRSLTAINGTTGETVVVDQSELAGTTPLWSPRVGFNWDATGTRSTQIRGGTGIFTGRLPFVWVGNNYSNPSFNPNIYHPATNPTVEPVVTSGPRPGSGGENFTLQQSFDGLSLMDPDFKWPQVWTTDIAIDQRLPGGVLGTLEFIYGKDINALFVQNMDLPAQSGTLADGRPTYGGQRNNGPDPFSTTNIYVLENTDEGWNVNLTAQLRKVWESGLGLTLSYAYLDARNTFKSTEIASVLWSGNPTQGNPNQPALAHSEFGQRHRIVLGGTYTVRWSRALRTKFGLFFDAAEGNSFRGAGGNRYSFLYAGDVNGDGANNDLIFIPRDESDIRLADPSQWAALNSFIEQDKYLSQNRGKIAERFGLINPWYQTLDLRILQDIILPAGGRENVIQLSVDFLNFTNLLNSSWGVRKVASALAQTPLTHTGAFEDGYPVVSFSGVQETFVDDPSEFSRWTIQVGLRYLLD